MGFWETFVKVWQVRTSIKIQERIEQLVENAKQNAETESNIDEIRRELHEKNELWYRLLNHHRDKSNR
jgi:hypothetical protein